MKYYLKSTELNSFVCIDIDDKTLLKVFNGTITFETEIFVQWQLDWHLNHDYETTTQQEFDDYYKKQVEILNSIVSC